MITTFETNLNRLNQSQFKFQAENQLNNDLYNEKQRRAEELFIITTGFRTIPANAHGPSCLDGFLVNNGQFKAGYEVKTRNDSISRLESYGSFILTKKKVENCIAVCSLLYIPFIAICYSIPDDAIRYWFVSNDRGVLTHNFRQEKKFLNKIQEDVFHFPFNQSYR